MESLRERVFSFLRHRNIRLNTDLGQHFLVDEEILRTIVTTADIKPDDHVVEIGPGIGILTSELLMHAGEVTAIELDDRMIPLIKDFLPPKSKRVTQTFTVIRGNALQESFPSTPYKIVANIPYHITSPLLRHAFLESPTSPTTMTLLIQREVAEKICDDEHAGILTIMVKLFGTPKIICTVPPTAFIPAPAVDSAVLHIISHAKPLADRPTIDQILKLLKISFAGKRKMLRNTFGNLENGMDLLAKAGIDPKRRPETLSVEEWIELARRSTPL
ncbi:MAG: ribosomal RNA small subunit methyltransferase A [Candidatus Peribacteraceae bacterium]|nr:ribosomal RNA small subunit methyltransferase A [Candidatus Peribacteraceae bacterium]